MELEQPSEQLKMLNSKLKDLNDLKNFYEKMHLVDFTKENNLKYMELLENKSIMDFEDITSIQQLNLKITRDVLVLKNLFK